MIHFIFTMLFYGAFLGCLVIVCMWFFLGMTVQQSIRWIKDKINQTQSVVVSETKDVARSVQRAGTPVEYKIDDTIRKLK